MYFSTTWFLIGQYKKVVDYEFSLPYGSNMTDEKSAFAQLSHLADEAGIKLVDAMLAAGLTRKVYYNVRDGADMRWKNFEQVKKKIAELAG